MEYLPLTLTIVAVCLAIYYFFFKSQNSFKTHGIPYITPKPIIGNLGPLLIKKSSMPELLQRFYDLDPEAKYVGVYDMNTPVIMLRDIELIKSIGRKNFDSFQDHRLSADDEMDPLFGKSLFFLKGEQWKDMRASVSPSFTSSKMKSMFMLMTNCAIDFADYVSKLPVEDRDMELKDLVAMYTNDVISSCAFGVNVDTKRDPNNAIHVYGKRATRGNKLRMVLNMMLYRSAPRIAKAVGAKMMEKEVEDFFFDMIKTTVRTRDEKGISRPDMIQLMMDARKETESGKALTNDDIVVLAFTFFFGGFDSVSTQLCFILYHLALDPVVQEKLYNEIAQVWENSLGKVTYEAIMGMKYLEAVINEGMRISPAAPLLDRLCVKRFELPPAVPGAKPYTVEVGSNLWIPVYPIQHDPDYFDDPYKFDPERFLLDGKKIMNSGTYMPFGIGPRMCIGNRFALINMKVLLFHLLSRCELKRCTKTEVPLKLTSDLFTVTAVNGFWIKVEPRKVHPPLQVLVSNETCVRRSE